MRAAVPFLALAAFAALGACNRTHSAADANVAIAAADPAPAGPQTAAGPQAPGGLWRQRVSGPQGVSVTRYCLDAGAASALASFNQRLSGRCAEHQMALTSDGSWKFKTACDTASGKVMTEGSLRGDLARHYVVQAEQQSVAGMTHLTADVMRLGDCPKDMKPGDVILPGGVHGRLSALPASA